MNYEEQLEKSFKLWECGGHERSELIDTINSFVEEAFLVRIQPTRAQLGEWKTSSDGRNLLLQHVYNVSGMVLTVECVNRLWRYFLDFPQVRERSTRYKFLKTTGAQKVCQACGKTEGPFHVDHIISLKRGGTNQQDNLTLLCRTCNLRKGAGLATSTSYFEFL